MNQSKYQQTFGSNQELFAGFPAAVYQATLQNDRIYFATHILSGPVDPVTMQNTSVTKWAVLNVANVTIQKTGSYRQLQGAFVESTGVLDAPLTSLINNYYPALTVNSANVAGMTFAWMILSSALPVLLTVQVTCVSQHCCLAGISFAASGSTLAPGGYFACVNVSNGATLSIQEVKHGEASVARCDNGGPYGSSRYAQTPLDPPVQTSTKNLCSSCHSMSSPARQAVSDKAILLAGAAGETIVALQWTQMERPFGPSMRMDSRIMLGEHGWPPSSVQRHSKDMAATSCAHLHLLQQQGLQWDSWGLCQPRAEQATLMECLLLTWAIRMTACE